MTTKIWCTVTSKQYALYPLLVLLSIKMKTVGRDISEISRLENPLLEQPDGAPLHIPALSYTTMFVQNEFWTSLAEATPHATTSKFQKHSSSPHPSGYYLWQEELCGNKHKRPIGYNRSPDKNSHCIFANAMQHSSSIATVTGTQIWPCHKKVKGHISLIILTNLVDLESLMLYTKIQPQSFLSTGEEDFYKYVQSSHLVQWCKTFWTNCQHPFNRRPHVKSG